MGLSDHVSIRRFRESDLYQLVQLISDTIGISYAASRLQRGGRGKGLMKALENEARARGVTEIGLSISLTSKRFYESIGYKVVQERSRDVGEGRLSHFWKAVQQLSQ
jgi:GNAT superfamily N-acetyltransferase